MKNIFSRTSSHWVRYSNYEWKADTKGTLYLTPTGSAKPEIYDPINESESLVLEALNVGKLCMSKSPDEDTRNLYRQSMATFDGIAPTYHIALLDKPTIVWDFHSLLLGIQMMFSFMLTEDKKPLKICRHCNTVFVANRQDTVFCSPQCKNRYNVYKSEESKWRI